MCNVSIVAYGGPLSLPGFPSPFLCFSSVTLTLTSADTDQVASSQWVSMEPSNRKQVRPGAPALMLNVAAEKTLCFDGVKQHQLKRPGVRCKEKIPSPGLCFSMCGV